MQANDFEINARPCSATRGWCDLGEVPQNS
jgi:hypothetical protein